MSSEATRSKNPDRGWLSRAIKSFRIERTCRRSEMRKNLRQTFTISPLPPLLFCIEGTRGKFSWLAGAPTYEHEKEGRKEQMHKILPSTTSVKEERRVLRMFSPTKSFLPPSFLFSPSSTLTFPSRSLGLAKEGPPSPLSGWRRGEWHR